MTRFPAASHHASWAGMCQGSSDSGGKHRWGQTCKGTKLAAALVDAGTPQPGPGFVVSLCSSNRGAVFHDTLPPRQVPKSDLDRTRPARAISIILYATLGRCVAETPKAEMLDAINVCEE